LQRAGFRLALDDYVPGDSRDSMLKAADFVKVDLVLTPPDQLESLVGYLRQSGAKLVAEKVETREEFQQCLELGFDLFQGYYFAKPMTLAARRQDPEHAALFQAFRALSADTELGELENCFKRNARLGIQLLRLANSAGVGASQRITTLRHAIMYLGRVQLRRWVLLMLYAGGEAGRGVEALAEIATVRGRLLELLLGSAETKSGDHVAKECAFLAGMLSLADVLLGRDLAEVMTELKIDRVIREAVLERRGPIALLLEIVECLEHGRFHMLAEHLAEAGITTEQLAEAQSEAYTWIRSVYQGTGPTIHSG
jgi:EAL and modified HD-GYP domain-containing signal transduction protein